jgi:hypothetical protein
MNISRTHLNRILAQLDEMLHVPELTSWHRITIKLVMDLLRMYWHALEYRNERYPEEKRCWK